MKAIHNKFIKYLRTVVSDDVDFDIEDITKDRTKIYFRTGFHRLYTSAVLELTEISSDGDFELVFNMSSELNLTENDLYLLAVKHNSGSSIIECIDKIAHFFRERGYSK
jgi:hypothetical protein